MSYLLHFHWLFIALFLASYLIKSFLFLSNSNLFEKYRKNTLIPESIFSAGFLITGIIMLLQIGFAGLGGWFHLKLTLVIVSIPLGIVGFKKKNKALVSISAVIFIYVFALALKKTPLLLF
jgi:uncharacterized membrane protein SirB2